MSQPSPDHVRNALRKIVASSVFVNAERMRRFLEFIIEHTLCSPNEPLKEMIVGVEIYAVNGDFDPRISSVVRVDAARLRTKLREYYGEEGAADLLTIDLPKGSYTPVFRSKAVEPVLADANSIAHPAEASIVVLPFSNLSPEPADYFSDGLTEEIIHALSSVQGLHVVARTSAFALKHRNVDIRELGRTLNVGFVLEGSVRKAGEALRVTVQLVNATDGYQMWSRRYDRRIEDIFAVQDEIAHEVAKMLRTSTTNPSASLLTDPGSIDAYDWYLRGRYHLNRQPSEDAFHKAIDCFEKVSARSPRHGPAFSGLAHAWLRLGIFAMEAPLAVLPKAREAAARGLEVNELEGEALCVVAIMSAMFDWDYAGAETLFRKALEAQPGSDLSRRLYAVYALAPTARFDEAIALLDQARRIDPLSFVVSANRAAVLRLARRRAEAEAECRRALELDPNFWRAMVGLGLRYEEDGRYEDAIACFERAKEISEGIPNAIGALGHAYALADRRADAHRLLQELDEMAERRYVSPWGRALIYLGLRDDRVFDWLERSCRERIAWVIYLAADPRFDPLRSDARFRSVLQCLRLPIITY
jgi:TolB-like protein/Flp pilus assembly protein TadD